MAALILFAVVLKMRKLNKISKQNYMMITCYAYYKQHRLSLGPKLAFPVRHH